MESPKTVQSVKNSLKFKAQEKEGVLSVRVGVRKFNVPLKARMLSNGKYLFLSFPASSELYLVSQAELTPMDRESDASDAYTALNPGRRPRRRSASAVEMPDELANALRGIPEGFRLGYNADGSPKLIRTRHRQKKA